MAPGRVPKRNSWNNLKVSPEHLIHSAWLLGSEWAHTHFFFLLIDHDLRLFYLPGRCGCWRMEFHLSNQRLSSTFICQHFENIWSSKRKATSQSLNSCLLYRAKSWYTIWGPERNFYPRIDLSRYWQRAYNERHLQVTNLTTCRLQCSSLTSLTMQVLCPILSRKLTDVRWTTVTWTALMLPHDVLDSGSDFSEKLSGLMMMAFMRSDLPGMSSGPCSMRRQSRLVL